MQVFFQISRWQHAFLLLLSYKALQMHYENFEGRARKDHLQGEHIQKVTFDT